MKGHILILSPGSWPWQVSGEATFLEPEALVARERFDRVIVVPQTVAGERDPFPDGLELETSYAEEAGRLSSAKLAARAATSGLVEEEFIDRWRDLRDRRVVRELVAHAGRAQHARDWLTRLLARQQLPPDRVIVETFWWTPATTGFALARQRHPSLRVFTRAHGFDLYEDRHEPAYIPCRRAGLRWLCGVFPDSDRGTRHLHEQFPQARLLIETGLPGIFDPGVRSPPSTDGVLRVATCALLRPIKRMNLLIEGLAAAARLEPNRRFEWEHFGNGPDREATEAHARAVLPPTVKFHFAGYASQAGLFEAYGSRPADVFVNVSKSEGTAVSLLEAIACGIPLLVTAVGGNVEVCQSNYNGLHLSPNPTAEEVGRALLRFAPDRPEQLPRRDASRAVWASRYDARRNHEAFYRRLVEWPSVTPRSPRAQAPTGS
jgi:glycosyltransferase involved in cell wall biosynthesis